MAAWMPPGSPGRQTVAQRLARALAVSGAAHAFLLANITFAPLMSGLPGSQTPITVRLARPEVLPALAQAPSPGSKSEQRPADPGSRDPSPPSAAALPAQDVYYKASELDQRAEPLSVVDVEYPAQALAARTRGTVRLRLMIDHRGELTRAEVVSSTPAGVFEEAALKAVRALRFRPAVRNGVPVGSIKTIEVPFDPDCTLTGSCEQ